MVIVGINAYHGDVSAVLVCDGELVAAVEEERFRRVKHWAGFPSEALQACLDMAGVEAGDIDHFAISRDPHANLWRKALFALQKRPSFDLVRDRLQNASRVRDVATDISESLSLPYERVKSRLHQVEHHPTHLASAFFVSPFDEAAVCAIDGFGDFVSTSWAVGRGNTLDVFDKVYFPHSLGLLYLAITQYLGFPKYGDEYKVMGLAPYGEPNRVEPLRQLFRLLSDGRFALDLSYFCHWSDGVQMTWDEGEPTMGRVFTAKLEELLGPARKPDEPVQAEHEALATSLQVVFEEAACHVLHALYQRTRLPRLCLAGGCAMNSVMNGKIRERTPFEEIYIQPAAGDNGTALGAAFLCPSSGVRPSHAISLCSTAIGGPAFDNQAISQVLEARQYEITTRGCRTRNIQDEGQLCQLTAQYIAAGKVIGWFQGRMEWGARALGNRRILADPRRKDMREIINTKIKFREKFRPFAPSVLEEAIDEYFVGSVPDPFMVQVYPVRPDKRDVIPAVTHVDGSGRLQNRQSRNQSSVCALAGCLCPVEWRADSAQHFV